MLLQDKVAIITGGATGIGAATARRFCEEGAGVVIADVDVPAGQALGDELAGAGALFLALDVTDRNGWKAVVAAAEAHFGAVNVLVNNAGIYARRTLLEIDDADFDRLFAVNVKAVMMGSREIIPAMRRAGGGSIVNLSSIAGLVGSVLSTDYNASKGAVRLLTKSIALQHAKENIRCNSVHPAPIATPMGFEAMPEGAIRQRRLAEIPMGRMGTPTEVANAVVFLASDLSSYMTASELVVDGGVTAR